MIKKLLIVALFFLSFNTLTAEIVLEDDGVTLSRQELELVVEGWPKDIQSEAAEDESVRESFLGQLIINKKIARELDKIKEADDPALYWKTQWMLITEKTKIYTSHMLKGTKKPNMEKLAKEVYKVEKKEYAFSPEKRASSHILLQCVPEKGCDLNVRLKEANKILEELDNSGDFEALVEKYSEDLGTKRRKGSLGAKITLNQANIDSDYRKALFSLSKKGDHSAVIKSQFGFHIIRLDEIEKERFLTFEEAKANIIKTIDAKYREAQAKAFQAQFWWTENTKLNKDLLDKIFLKYKKKSND